MIWFLFGLVGFLALHSIRVVAPGWREARIAAVGEKRWKAVYSLLSIACFVLLVWGYGQARSSPILVWLPPPQLRHLGALLVLVAFVLFVAANVPRNAIKARLRHPMTLGTKSWALGHLLMSGWLHTMILAGAFLFWSVLVFAHARRRGVVTASGPSSVAMTVLTVVIGIVLGVLFALYLHGPLIGMKPF